MSAAAEESFSRRHPFYKIAARRRRWTNEGARFARPVLRISLISASGAWTLQATPTRALKRASILSCRAFNVRMQHPRLPALPLPKKQR